MLDDGVVVGDDRLVVVVSFDDVVDVVAVGVCVAVVVVVGVAVLVVVLAAVVAAVAVLWCDASAAWTAITPVAASAAAPSHRVVCEISLSPRLRVSGVSLCEGIVGASIGTPAKTALSQV